MRPPLPALLAGLLMASAHGAILRVEDFQSDPAPAGWKAVGDTRLYAWDQATGALQVTWDSGRSNSGYVRPLGTVLTRAQDFGFGFDLILTEVQGGVRTNLGSTFQLALGLLRLADATRPELQRGTGTHPVLGPRNVLEFDYFPDTGFGATVSMALVSSNNQFADPTRIMNFPVVLEAGVRHRVALHYTASNGVLRTTVEAAGQGLGPIQDLHLEAAAFTDFRFDHVGVLNYSDAGQAPPFGGSILAHGWVDNLWTETPEVLPLPVALRDAGDTVEISFSTRAGWCYALESTVDLVQWRRIRSEVATADGRWVWREPKAPGGACLYRVSADLP